MNESQNQRIRKRNWVMAGRFVGVLVMVGYEVEMFSRMFQEIENLDFLYNVLFLSEFQFLDFYINNFIWDLLWRLDVFGVVCYVFQLSFQFLCCIEDGFQIVGFRVFRWQEDLQVVLWQLVFRGSNVLQLVFFVFSIGIFCRKMCLFIF